MMELTKDTFADFIARLQHHNRGGGVDEHCTANPLFIVQQRTRIVGIDLDFDPEHLWTDCPEHGAELTNEEIEAAILEEIEESGPVEPYDLDYDKEIKRDGETIFEKFGYIDTWDFVSAHFTKEAAEAFIARKKHDYRELRVYVDCQYCCWEYNAIIKGFLDGKIIFQDCV